MAKEVKFGGVTFYPGEGVTDAQMTKFEKLLEIRGTNFITELGATDRPGARLRVH